MKTDRSDPVCFFVAICGSPQEPRRIFPHIPRNPRTGRTPALPVRGFSLPVSSGGLPGKKAGLSKALPFSFPARMPEHAQHLPSQPGRDREPEARPELPAGGVAADDAARGADDPDGDAGDVACRALFRDAVVPVARECEAVAVAADDAVEDVAAAAAEPAPRRPVAGARGRCRASARPGRARCAAGAACCGPHADLNLAAFGEHRLDLGEEELVGEQDHSVASLKTVRQASCAAAASGRHSRW